MPYARVVISSGHGKFVRGASGILDEVDEARKVVEDVASGLRDRGVDTKVFHDDTSKSQNENLNTIVNYHNKQQRELDVSVHFNAYQNTTKPMGTECLYLTQNTLAGQVSFAIASVGFINRGPKKRGDLFFLNKTNEPAILIEVCFVDSQADADLYKKQFGAVCDAIADVLGGEDEGEVKPPPEPIGALFQAKGKASHFGGPKDMGVSPDEGLAFISDVMQAPQLFLPYQPEGTTGLARRLNPHVHYVACRWDYAKTPKTMMLQHVALVRAVKTNITMKAFPADWGPHTSTQRVADLSPGLMDDLGLQTDDEVEVIFPYGEDV